MASEFSRTLRLMATDLAAALGIEPFEPAVAEEWTDVRELLVFLSASACEVRYYFGQFVVVFLVMCTSISCVFHDLHL